MHYLSKEYRIVLFQELFSPSIFFGRGEVKEVMWTMTDKKFSVIANKGFQIKLKKHVVRVSFGAGDKCENYYTDDTFHPLKSDDAEITIFRVQADGCLVDMSSSCPSLRAGKGYKGVDSLVGVLKWVQGYEKTLHDKHRKCKSLRNRNIGSD